MNKHAYLIIAHSQFELLKMTLGLLDSEYNDFYIHIDKKITDVDFDDIRSAVSISNVTFVDRLSVSWGGYSLTECELKLLSAAVSGEYSYYHLISGVDMPIKTAEEIYRHFEDNLGCQFLHFCTDEFVSRRSVQARVRHYHPFHDRIGKKSKFIISLDYYFSILQSVLGINRWKRSPLVFDCGANWFSITHDVAQYIVDSKDTIEKYFRHSFCSDEVFVQSLLRTKFGDSLRIYRAELGSDYRTVSRHIDWKRGSPYVFRREDFSELISSECMFARKFDMNIDPEICYELYNYLSDKKK